MDVIRLTDPDKYPGEGLLGEILGDSFPVYEAVMNSVTGIEYGLEPLWRFYNDGKAWLCKVVFKKKTIFWLSVWDGYFKVAFYFNERHCAGIRELDIDPGITDALSVAKPFGTLYPVVLEMRKKEQISDLLILADYKKRLR
jgi:hypothetical protein